MLHLYFAGSYPKAASSVYTCIIVRRSEVMYKQVNVFIQYFMPGGNAVIPHNCELNCVRIQFRFHDIHQDFIAEIIIIGGLDDNFPIQVS